MTLSKHTAEVADWLTSNGWSPSRDIGSMADDLIRIRVEDAARQGWHLGDLETATRFIRSYGELELPYPWAPLEAALKFDPTAGYDGDVEAFDELAQGLGKKIFPVGYETHEFGIWLVDEIGRFFYLHHTGGYFLGENEYEAFDRALSGKSRPDAEDFFV
ncbi:SUKH-3 domain-containing protein [Streptomyces sp. NPDC053079]|uniref:SUKH-3 domain-containing protein n=1 Tax=Streptomyces sp. NPDC053079 TaxID=3365697 RepID=UPI0037D2FC39